MGRSIRFAARGLVIAAALVVVMAVPAAADPRVSPVLECVAVNGDGTFTALFGVENTSGQTITIPVGSSNQVTPTPHDRGQPTVFAPGHTVGVFTVSQDVGQPIKWKVGNTTVQATSESLACNSAPQDAEAPVVVGLLVVAGAVATVGYRRLTPAPA